MDTETDAEKQLDCILIKDNNNEQYSEKFLILLLNQNYLSIYAAQI